MRWQTVSMPMWWRVLVIASPLLYLAYSLYTLPHWLTRLAARIFPSVLFFCDGKRGSLQKYVALTIDDSVDQQITQQALAVLREHGAKATFFIIGDHSDTSSGQMMLQQLVAEGHELGNHTWMDRPSWKLPPDDLKQEMVAVDRLLTDAYQAAGNPRPAIKWFRPGCGFFTRRMLRTAKDLGYRTVLGNVFPHDPWVKNWRLNAWLVMLRVEPGAIIILHDGRPWLIPTLQDILPKLTARGYQALTLSELVEKTYGCNITLF